MVAGSRTEGGAQILSAGVRKTIQSIKEIVGNHSDAEIYSTLKETNMNPNETAQKLLNQDPFHEVKRKRDKRKECLGQVTANIVHTASQPNKLSEPINQGTLYNVHSDRDIHRGGSIHNSVNQGILYNAHSDRNIRRGGANRNSLPDAKVIREFRVVKDNRTCHNPKSEIRPPVQDSPDKSSIMTSHEQNQPAERHSSKSSNGNTDSQPRHPREIKSNDKKEPSENRRVSVPKDNQPIGTKKANDPEPNSATSPKNSVTGLYSSSSDPVHVPSPDSRPAANIGAIKREVGAVGVRRLTDISAKASSTESPSSNQHLGRDGRSSAAISKSGQSPQTSVNVAAVRSISVSRPSVNNQHVNRQHQSLGHQKASSQSNKEWKPKSSKTQSAGPGVIGTPAKSASPPENASKSSEVEATQLQDKLSRVNISENQNVIIAPHIRLSTTDRYRVTFGSMGTEFEPFMKTGSEAIQDAAKPNVIPAASVPIATPESSGNESSKSKQLELLDERVRISGSSSPASASVSEQQLTETKETSSPQDLDNYADIGLVRENSPSYTPSELQQHQDHPPSQFPIFSAYDPQTVYDIPYFRSTADETARVQSLQFAPEAMSSHAVNSISSSVAMVQPQLAQMYPQVHVSHYPNLMPYRQFISPVYVPPMAMPAAGYSSNPAYPHPSNGSSYLMMPGGSSHLSQNGLKYGIQQFKPVPTGSQTGFGNFTSPNGYAINAPGVGSATGLEDSSRLKFKDGNLYVPNPQAETSEIWMSPRDLPSMQSGSYYNMTGQTPHATYLPSHNSHAPFNAAAQSSHMQFPGMYHTPQPAGIPSPHHLSPAMGGNVGVGVAAGGPATQVNAYQQPHLGHMNWTGNF
ncbi:GBF-interacting protein 1-like isoform X4 [Daucus carota subsp. sativus]|uniref:GBF-interacting protein 1-like isoform X4 n=1 Tax=Daucus carota subsp. sativus TaxID=79200 RepID=UPI003083A172